MTNYDKGENIYYELSVFLGIKNHTIDVVINHEGDKIDLFEFLETGKKPEDKDFARELVASLTLLGMVLDISKEEADKKSTTVMGTIRSKEKS